MESGPLSRFLGAGAFCEKGGEKEAPEEGGAGEGEGGGLELAAECDEDGESQDGEGEDGQNYEAESAAELSFHKLYRLIKVTKNQGVMQGSLRFYCHNYFDIYGSVLLMLRNMIEGFITHNCKWF